MLVSGSKLLYTKMNDYTIHLVTDSKFCKIKIFLFILF